MLILVVFFDERSRQTGVAFDPSIARPYLK